MNLHQCPDCKGPPSSPMDRCYIGIFATCYDCDIRRWKAGELAEQDLDNRHKVALDRALTTYFPKGS